MQTIKVLKTDDISGIENNTYIHCKELRKGIIKRDFSVLGLGSETFENVTNAIESLNYDSLIANGFDSVLFHANLTSNQGEIEKSLVLQKFVENSVKNLFEGQARDFVTNLRNNKKYFVYNIEAYRNGKDVTISGDGVTAGYTVEVHGQEIGLLGEDLVGEDGLYEIIIKDLTIGIWQLIIKIITPEGEVVSESVIDVPVINEFVNPEVATQTTDPIIGSAEPGAVVDIYNSENQLVGTTTAAADGTYSIIPVGMTTNDTTLQVVVDNIPQAVVEVTPLSEVVNIPTPLPEVGTTMTTTPETNTIDVGDVTIVEEEDKIPYISGSVTNAFSTIIVTINDIIIGRTIANADLSWKVFLTGLDALGVSLNDPVIDIKIIVLDPPKRNSITPITIPTTFPDGVLSFSVHNTYKATLYSDFSGKYYFEVDRGIAPLKLGPVTTNMHDTSYVSAQLLAVHVDYDNNVLKVFNIVTGELDKEVYLPNGAAIHMGYDSGLSSHKYITANFGQEAFLGDVPSGFYAGFGEP